MGLLYLFTPLLPLYAFVGCTGTILPFYEIRSSIPLYKNYNHISQDEETVKFKEFSLWIVFQSVAARTICMEF
jgi:hypothetical protein